MSKIDYTIIGIPCIINVTHFYSQAPDASCKSSDMDFQGYEEIEYEVLDRKGYKADWLAAKVTELIDAEIKLMIIDTLTEA
jgi:hypothetical protein